MKEYYLNLYTKTRNEYFDYLRSLLLHEEKKFVITANTETFMLGIEDKEINEMLIKNLANKVAISAGSACGIGEPSYVIQAIGKYNCTNHFIRISLNKNSFIDDISKLNI